VLESLLDRAAGLATGTTGLVIGIFADDRTTFYAVGAPQPDEHTLYEIGSITKVFTSLLLADMVVRGEVQLEQPAADLLPHARSLPASITLLSLATHTSGLPRLPGNFWAGGRIDHAAPYATYLESDLWAYLATVTPDELADTAGRIQYSNLGMGVLGAALASRLDLTYEDAVQMRVCQPLGLTATTTHLSAEDAPKLAAAHDGKGSPTKNAAMLSLAGAGALLSNASEILAFLRAHLAPDDWLRARTDLTLRTHAADFAPPRPIFRLFALYQKLVVRHPLRRPKPTGIGLGWFSVRLLKSRAHAWTHNGGTTGYKSFAGFVPESNIAVVVLRNRGVRLSEIAVPRYGVDDLGFELLDVLAD